MSPPCPSDSTHIEWTPSAACGIDYGMDSSRTNVLSTYEDAFADLNVTRSSGYEKPLSSCHWYDFAGTALTKADFLAHVAATTLRMPPGTKHLLSDRDDPVVGPALDAYWYKPDRVLEILRSYGITESPEDFIGRSAKAVMVGVDRQALDALFAGRLSLSYPRTEPPVLLRQHAASAQVCCVQSAKCDWLEERIQAAG